MKTFTYTIAGRLQGSGCIHVCPITGAQFRRLRKRIVERINATYGYLGVRDFSTDLRYTSLLHSGYSYCDVRLSIYCNLVTATIKGYDTFKQQR